MYFANVAISVPSVLILMKVPVHAWKKLVHEHQFTRAPSVARVTALTYLDLHMQSKICVSAKEFLVAEAIQIFHLR